jgi:hypothetical protein
MTPLSRRRAVWAVIIANELRGVAVAWELIRIWLHTAVQ